jgi:hypothetical protein
MLEKKDNYFELAFICGVLIFLSVAGIVWYAASPLLRGSLDGRLLVAVCLMIGIIFGYQFTSIARAAGWLKQFKHSVSTHISKIEESVNTDSERSSRLI